MSKSTLDTLAEDSFLISGSVYHIVYAKNDLNDNLIYHIFNRSHSRRRPTEIIVDVQWNALPHQRRMLTQEEAIACYKKGFRIPEHLIKKQKVSMTKQFFNSIPKQNTMRILLCVLWTMFRGNVIMRDEIVRSRALGLSFSDTIKVAIYQGLYRIMTSPLWHHYLGRDTYWAVRYFLKRLIYSINAQTKRDNYSVYVHMLKNTRYRIGDMGDFIDQLVADGYVL
jgi:hypothetical protein